MYLLLFQISILYKLNRYKEEEKQWLTLFSGHTSSRVSSMSVVNSVTTYLSWISAKQILKNSLSLLTFFMGDLLIICSNRSGIDLTCQDFDS